MLRYNDLAREVAALADEVEVAVHGDDAALHDSITRSPGSFAQTMRGVRNLLAAGASVSTNTVVTRLNLARLPAVARLLVAEGVRQVQFANVHPEGNALDDAEALVPRLSELEAPLAEALRAVGAAGATAYAEAVPLCFLPGLERCAIELHLPAEVELREPGLVSRDFLPERRAEKVKGPQCRPCALEAGCEGAWRGYARLYGLDELRPVLGRVELPEVP
jgi:cyclic pyranopterin phosphate synthase